jgi:hypothetical protein
VSVKDTVYHEKVQNVNVLSGRIVKAAVCVLPIKCLLTPGKKLNTVFMCVVPLMVGILISTEHTRNCVMSSV